MADLFRRIFEHYGAVGQYPKFGKLSGFHWCLYCDLDRSFEFLLVKPSQVPEWALDDSCLFFSFLAGYFDAEGSISFEGREGYRTISILLNSCDTRILQEVKTRLEPLGLEPSFRRVVAGGTKGYRRDYWSLRLGKRSQVKTFLRSLELRHPEKVALSEIVTSSQGVTNEKDPWEIARAIRAAIRRDVTEFRREAMSQMARRDQAP